MEAKESLEIRTEMAKMHDKYKERMSEAYKNKEYVETVWLCYAIMEQRVSRLICKYIDQCNVPDRTDQKTAAISTRVS